MVDCLPANLPYGLTAKGLCKPVVFPFLVDAGINITEPKLSLCRQIDELPQEPFE